MINVQSVIDLIESSLDAEGSDRYTFAQDYKPAINYSIGWIQTVFNFAFSDKKLTEENLRFLVKSQVFQPSGYSRIDLGLLPHSVWSILRVNPEAKTDPEATPLSGQPDSMSFYRPDLTFVKSEYSAKKLTLEQWDENRGNIFEAGNESLLSGGFKSYAYLNFVSHGQTSQSEVEIRPDASGQFVGVTYLKNPDKVQLVSDDLELPESLLNLIVEKSLHFISVKQGDQTTLRKASSEDVNELVKLMI